MIRRPPDLEAFWSETAAALAEVDADLRVAALPPDADVPRAAGASIPPGVALSRVSFRSLGGVRVRGYTLVHDGDAPRPLVVHAHGYRSHAEVRAGWAAAGCDVVGFDVRGFGRSTGAVDEPSPAGWLLTGVRRPETAVLRGAVCDYARAVQVAPAIVGRPVARLVVHGVSLAGGLATMAEATWPRADLLALGVPTFGWVEGRRLLVERGSGAEVSAFLDANPEYSEDDVQSVLAYFDAAALAARVRCPTLLGVGRVDRVVPAPTVREVAARLGGPTEVLEFPVSHDAGPLMAAWDAFDARLLQLAVDGVPDGFGAQASAAVAATQVR